MIREERITKEHFFLIDDFDCGVEDKPLTYFLLQEAIHYDEEGMANTYLVFADKESKEVIGYYTLRSNSIVYKEETNKLQYIPVVELARLAINHTYQRQGYGTEILLQFVIDKVLKIKRHIGCKAILAFASSKKAKLFYESIGFVDFGIYDENGNNMIISDDGFNYGCHVLLLAINHESLAVLQKEEYQYCNLD